MHHIKIMLSRLWQCADRTRDRLLFPGCDFAAWVTQEAAGFTPEQGNQYQPSTNALPQVLRRFPITSGDRILDVGCGKGKAMALMRRFPFGQVAGFDISPALADVANRNFRQLKLRDCHAFQADAATFTGMTITTISISTTPCPSRSSARRSAIWKKAWPAAPGTAALSISTRIS